MGTGRIAWRHVLPNASGPIIVAATLRIAEAIILESTLSFIGLGIQPPHASLGSMLQKGLTRLLDAPWMVWFPGSADRADRAGLQLRRRRHPGRARPEAAALVSAKGVHGRV